MEGRSQGVSFQHVIPENVTDMISQNSLEEIQHWRSNWYLSEKEIEDHSPSRKDGIDLKKESRLRKLYCSFLHDLGMKLKVPQFTIATATMFCHRFYLHQSHAKNDWQTIATVSMFLACKAEETPRLLVDVIVVAYEILYSRDPNASQRIKQKAVYEKQKELILIGERVLLTTIGFDLNIQHPYKPLMAALKKLTIPHKEVAKVAWNFVNDWLRTTLCLQYKPHYIAAGSMYLAAKFCKVKLPSERGKVWWLEFDVSPQQLEEVIKRMLKLLEGNNQPQKSSSQDKARQAAPVAKTTLSSPQSCVLNGCKAPSESSIGIKEEAGVGARPHSSDACLCNSQAVPTEDICSVGNRIVAQCQTSDCGSSQSGIEEGNRTEEVEIQARVEESNQTATCTINPECGGISRSGNVSSSGGLSKIDRDRIREALRKRKYEKAANKKVVDSLDEGKDDDSWIVRELEIGVELGSAASGHKRQRC